MTISDNTNSTTNPGLLSFSNTVLSATGGAFVTFANTDDNGGSEDNVQLMGTINVTSISAGGQILAVPNSSTMVRGQTVMLNAGNGIGSPTTPIDTDAKGLDATTNTGGIYIQNTGNTANQYHGQVTFAPNAAGDTMAPPTSSNTTWTSLGYAPGDIIVVSGASAATDNGGFAVASVSNDRYTLTLQNSNVFTAETDPNVSVYDTVPVSASTSTGNIVLSSPGNMTLVSTGISTNPNGTVTLNAGGTIFNASSPSAAVTAGTLNLTANQVGTSANPLQTSVASLTVSAPGGGSLDALYLSNNTALTVTSVNCAGNVSISAMGDLALEGSLSGNSVTLMAPAGALSSTTTATTNGMTTTTVTSGVLISAQKTLTISAEQIGDSSAYSPDGSLYAVTNFLQTDAPTINATANYGGIYISNDDGPVPLALTAAAVGPTTSNGGVTNNIEIYSAGSIFIAPQTSEVTADGGSQAVGVFNPGGTATVEAGETESATGGIPTPTPTIDGLPFTVCDAFAIVSGLDSTSSLTVGMAVSGTGIPSGDTIAGVHPTGSPSDGGIVLSEPATATNTGVTLTFGSGPEKTQQNGNTLLGPTGHAVLRRRNRARLKFRLSWTCESMSITWRSGSPHRKEGLTPRRWNSRARHSKRPRTRSRPAALSPTAPRPSSLPTWAGP